MKGDFSKWSFNPADNFTGVLEQQGRARLDQDGNAATQIVNHLRTTLVQDAIGTGVAAVPESLPDSFRVETARINGSDVEITFKQGRLWADGIPLLSQGAESQKMVADYLGPPISTTTPQVGSISAGDRDAIVLEVWEEAVSAFQDTDLIETALGGVDTSERIKAFYSLRLLRLGTNEDCDNTVDRLSVELPKGKLTARPADETIISGDCPVRAGGGYSGFEHSLYRIEIAEPDASGAARFKWSSFNGSLVGRGKYTPTPGDATTGNVEIRANDQMINQCGLTGFYFEALIFDASHGRWAVVMTADASLPDDGKLSLTNVDHIGTIGTEPVFFRLWNDIETITDYPDGLATPAELNDGILLEFDAPTTGNTNYLPGDYWTFPVRAAGVEYDLSLLPTSAEPQGVEYHRVPLAILNWTSPTVTLTAPVDIQDCREEFPQLVNVNRGCCIDVAPDEDLHTAVRKVKDAGGGCICLLPGEHNLTRPIDLSGESGICIKGFGVVSQLKISARVNTAAFTLTNSHDICFDGFAVVSAATAPVWACAQTSDLTLANLFVFAELKSRYAIVVTSGGAGSRWQVENNVFIGSTGLSGLSVYQSVFRSNSWLGIHNGIDLQNLMEVVIDNNYFLGISDADLKEFMALSFEVDLKREFTRQNIFQSLLQFLAQQNTEAVSTRYNAIELSGGFDLTITGNRMVGRIGLGCEIIENTKVTNNDFLTTLFGASCGIVRNLVFSENRIGLHIPNNPQAGVSCKVGLRVINDVIDCRVLDNSFNKVEEGIVFESDFDGGKETIRDFGVKSFVGRKDTGFDLKKVLKDSEKLTRRSKEKHILLKSTYFVFSKCERTRIEGNHFRASKLAIEWSGTRDVVDFRVSGNAISGCQQTAIQIEPDDKILFLVEPMNTKVRLIENNRFDIFGAAVRSTLGGVRILNNDIRVRKPKNIGIKDFDITNLLAGSFYRNDSLVKANREHDYGGSRMFMKEASSDAKKNPEIIKFRAFSRKVKRDYLVANPPHKGDTRADNLYLMSAMADASAYTLLLNYAVLGFFKANINQEGFAVNLGGIQNRVNGNTLYSDNPDIESGVIFNLLSGEARENNILVQRIGIMMNAKAGQSSQDVRIEGNTLKVIGPQSSGGKSEMAYALSIPTLKPGNLTIQDNYFEGSVMVGSEPFASLGLKRATDVNFYYGVIAYNAFKYDSGVFPYIISNKKKPKKGKPTEINNNVVLGLIDMVLFNFWDNDPHKSRPVVQFADNRVVRGWVSISQSTAGAFWTAASLKKQASKAMVLTLSSNTFDYWARVTGYDLILTGNHSQSAIQYRVGNTLEHVANIPKPKSF